jgi:hypothetical protein
MASINCESESRRMRRFTLLGYQEKSERIYFVYKVIKAIKIHRSRRYLNKLRYNLVELPAKARNGWVFGRKKQQKLTVLQI